ncbi:MAG: proteasome assembly chaperone family protein [Thaumarchaeota archaeon]|nr:proteasome assembly chaperone family protein [Nitrososphaerota archaeon]
MSSRSLFKDILKLYDEDDATAIGMEIKILSKPELKDPVLISGLPGSGYVAKLGIEHLAKGLNSELFAVIYSSSFPPQVMTKADGSTELMKHELHYWKNPEGGSDLILYTGDAQPVTPEAEYEFADRVLELSSSLGAKNVYTLAAYITGNFVEHPKVFGTATDKETAQMLSSMGVNLMTEGAITGMNGLLIGIAKIKNMKGVCLLGETSGYMVDPKAAQAVLESLSKILGIKVDLTTLEQRAKESEAILKNLEEMKRTGERAGRQPGKDLGYIS